MMAILFLLCALFGFTTIEGFVLSSQQQRCRHKALFGFPEDTVQSVKKFVSTVAKSSGEGENTDDVRR